MPEPERLIYGTPEHARAHHERFPHRVGMGPNTRRRSAAADAGRHLEAQRTARRRLAACGYLGCPKPATRRLKSPYARSWWLGCDDHHPAMSTALVTGQGSAAELLTVDLTKGDTPRPNRSR